MNGKRNYEYISYITGVREIDVIRMINRRESEQAFDSRDNI